MANQVGNTINNNTTNDDLIAIKWLPIPESGQPNHLDMTGIESGYLRHGQGQSPLRLAGMVEGHHTVRREIRVDTFSVERRRRRGRITDHMRLLDLSGGRGAPPEDGSGLAGRADQLQLFRCRVERR